MSATEIVSLCTIVLGTILSLICITVPYWKLNDPEDTIRDSIVRHEGLWIKCQTFTTGNWDCDDFNRFFLGLPTELQAARGFSLTSIVLSLCAIGAMVVGLESVPCGGDDKRMKKRVRLIAGCLAFVAGLLLMAAVSWYANDVRLVHEFATLQIRNNSSSSNTRYIFGWCLFVGWIGGALLMVGALLAVCTGCGQSSYEDSAPRYGYRPPTKAMGGGGGQEYI